MHPVQIPGNLRRTVNIQTLITGRQDYAGLFCMPGYGLTGGKPRFTMERREDIYMKIHGLQKMTLLDFPGKVACTVFLGGCDMRCPFCHNAELIDGTAPAVMEEEELLAFLKKRTGLLEGDWGKLALFAAVSAAAAAVLILVLGIFYRKLSLLQSEAPQASGKKGIQKGSIRVGSAFMANVKREVLTILRVPAYAVNILPITFMPLVIIIMMGMMFNKSAGESGAQSLTQMMGNLNPALIMCIMAAAVAYMAGMNPALSTAVTREGKGHDFIRSLPVSAKTLIHAKLAVGCGLETFGVIAAMIAVAVLIPGFTLETVLALILCLLFCFGTACLALSRDVKKPRLDWVTEQEAVKQNFGVLISMLVSWGILAALAGLAFVMIHFLNWGLIPVFAVLAALLAAAAIGAYKLLMKNVKKYYFAG